MVERAGKIFGIALAVLAATQFFAQPAHANKVDCTKVMSEVSAGKKTGEIAKDLNISTSSVYRCKKKMLGSKATAKNSPVASPGAPLASPAAAATHK